MATFETGLMPAPGVNLNGRVRDGCPALAALGAEFALKTLCTESVVFFFVEAFTQKFTTTGYANEVVLVPSLVEGRYNNIFDREFAALTLLEKQGGVVFHTIWIILVDMELLCGDRDMTMTAAEVLRMPRLVQSLHHYVLDIALT